MRLSATAKTSHGMRNSSSKVNANGSTPSGAEPISFAKSVYIDKLKGTLYMEERDHKKLGPELDLLYIDPVVGKGLPIFLPKGAIIKRELEKFVIEEETKRGYLHVSTPDLARLELYIKSGHYPHYKDSMYAPIKIDDDEF